jgi:hypothetical protein
MHATSVLQVLSTRCNKWIMLTPVVSAWRGQQISGGNCSESYTSTLEKHNPLHKLYLSCWRQAICVVFLAFGRLAAWLVLELPLPNTCATKFSATWTGVVWMYVTTCAACLASLIWCFMFRGCSVGWLMLVLHLPLHYLNETAIQLQAPYPRVGSPFRTHTWTNSCHRIL